MQGFCTPADEVESSGTPGTDFVDIEAGGFDQGQGETNVSDKAEPENIVRLNSNNLLLLLQLLLCCCCCHC